MPEKDIQTTQPPTRQEQEQEEATQDDKIQESAGIGLFSPEGIVMLSFAAAIDLFGFLLACFLLDDIGILDAFGLLTIGGWMLLRRGSLTTTKKGQKVGAKIAKRLGWSFFGELIPYFGGIAPCWTYAVYKTLKGG